MLTHHTPSEILLNISFLCLTFCGPVSLWSMHQATQMNKNLDYTLTLLSLAAALREADTAKEEGNAEALRDALLEASNAANALARLTAIEWAKVSENCKPALN